MTRLERRVRRVVQTPRRDYVVTLHPAEERGGEYRPPELEIREKRRREGERIALGALYVILVDRRAAMKRAARRTGRVNRKGLQP